MKVIIPKKELLLPPRLISPPLLLRIWKGPIVILSHRIIPSNNNSNISREILNNKCSKISLNHNNSLSSQGSIFTSIGLKIPPISWTSIWIRSIVI